MKRGPKQKSIATKKLAGTYRDCVDGDTVALAVVANGPVTPGYLTAEARLVWDEELARVVACGATEADSSIFARYCEMEASFRVSIIAGELPTSALITELRRVAELLGIAGQRSRLAKASAGQSASASPFSIRPK
nr:hypothetical protein [uncultured Sphingomonas sp.]